MLHIVQSVSLPVRHGRRDRGRRVGGVYGRRVQREATSNGQEEEGGEAAIENFQTGQFSSNVSISLIPLWAFGRPH